MNFNFLNNNFFFYNETVFINSLSNLVIPHHNLDDDKHNRALHSTFILIFRKYQKLCKKIGESLVEDRNEAESLLKTSPTDQSLVVLAEQRLDKINLLVESIKKKINWHFREIRPEPEPEPEQHTLALETSSIVVKEDQQESRVLEEARRGLEEEKRQLEETRVEQERRIEAERERLELEKIELSAEMERVRREKAELERRRVEQEQEALQRKQQQQQAAIIQQQQLNQQQQKQKEEVSSSSGGGGSSNKIMELIDQMKSQKWQHLKMSLDTLVEQHEIIRTQTRHVENEIKQMSKASARRMVIYF